MKITAISSQAKNENRVNVSVDGVYRFSLDVFQLVELGIRVGKDYSEEELQELQQESEFGKLYARTLEYTMLRPHSEKEVRDYLWRKTRASKYKTRSGEIKDREGVSQRSADRVLERLKEKGYIDDEKFTRYWVDNRALVKGVSRRKLQQELMQKGIANTLIEESLRSSSRDDKQELAKIIAKRRRHYTDDQKFMSYLARQGFSYDLIKEALNDEVDL